MIEVSGKLGESAQTVGIPGQAINKLQKEIVLHSSLDTLGSCYVML
jgi:hypothetical protein